MVRFIGRWFEASKISNVTSVLCKKEKYIYIIVLMEVKSGNE
jgi:hypothetical protein